MLVTFHVVCLKLVRPKHSYCLSHFLNLNYRGLNLDFHKLAQQLFDSDVESNQGPMQNDCKSARGCPKKIKVFKGTPKKIDLNRNINVNVASYPKVLNVFFNTNNFSA